MHQYRHINWFLPHLVRGQAQIYASKANWFSGDGIFFDLFVLCIGAQKATIRISTSRESWTTCIKNCNYPHELL